MRLGYVRRFQGKGEGEGELTCLEKSALPQLEVLWHYDCVVSPRSPSPSAGSHAAKSLHAGFGSPRSPLLASGLLSPSSPSSDSSPVSPRSPTALSTDGSLGGSSVVDVALHATTIRSSDCPMGLRAVAGTEINTHGTDVMMPYARPHPRGCLLHVFHIFDEDGDGHVSIDELCSIFAKLGIPKSQDAIESLLASSPSCHTSGHIDQEQFFLLYDSVCSYVEELDGDAANSLSDVEADVDEDLRAVFHVFDLDGNGYISAEELQAVLCALGFVQAEQLEACVDMIARVDENGDGHVDFPEFKKLMGAATPTLILSC